MTNRYLVIDDLRVFKADHWFPSDSEVWYARTSEDGLDALKNEKWAVVYLDHDLGGTDTIKPCLDYVLEFPERFRETLFFVHTSNAYEKDSMCRQLWARSVRHMGTEAKDIFDIDYDLYAKAVGI